MIPLDMITVNDKTGISTIYHDPTMKVTQLTPLPSMVHKGPPAPAAAIRKYQVTNPSDIKYRLEEINHSLRSHRFQYLWYPILMILVATGFTVYMILLLDDKAHDWNDIKDSTDTDHKNDVQYAMISSIVVLAVLGPLFIELIFGILAYLLKIPLLAKVYRRFNIVMLAFCCFVVAGVGFLLTANAGPFVCNAVILVLLAGILCQGNRHYKLLKERRHLMKASNPLMI